MAPRLVVLLAATVVATAAAASAVTAFPLQDSEPITCSSCRMRDACTGKLVDTDHGKTYVDGCGNSNLFKTDCTVDVLDAGPEPTCPSKCDGVQKPRHVRDVYQCFGKTVEMMPGCNEKVVDTAYDSTPMNCTACELYDSCKGACVTRGAWKFYEDKCGNQNLFKPDCSVGVNELKAGPGCPSTCNGVEKTRKVRAEYTCNGTLLKMLPGCNEEEVTLVD
eukprot:contig_39979_g9214